MGRADLTSFDVLLYRLYFLPMALSAAARRWPKADRALTRLKTSVKRHILPDASGWMRVQSGLAQGLWMRLHLPDDARYWHGAHESALEPAIAAVVRPGAVVYDVGSHIGCFSLGAARLAGASGRVIAFDADPDNAARVRENSARNHLDDRLQSIHAAVWSYTAPEGIAFRRGNAHGGVEAGGVRPVLADGALMRVPAITLDDYIASGGPPPDLVKIDVEGGEYEVLRGAGRLFSTRRPLLIAEIHGPGPAESIRSWLSQSQYCAEWRVPAEQFPRHVFAWPAERQRPGW